MDLLKLNQGEQQNRKVKCRKRLGAGKYEEGLPAGFSLEEWKSRR